MIASNWKALTLYFQSYLADKDKTTKTIYQALNNIHVQLHYNFLAYILIVMNYLNLEFQSEEVRIHKYLDVVEFGLKMKMNNFITTRVLKEKNCFEISLENSQNLKPLNPIYFGTNVQQLIENASESEHTLVEIFQIRTLGCYQEFLKQIRSRINYQDSLLQQLKYVSPAVAISGKVSSIVGLYNNFKEILQSHMDIEALDAQWRAIPFIPNIETDVLAYAGKINAFRKKAKKSPIETSRMCSLTDSEQNASSTDGEPDQMLMLYLFSAFKKLTRIYFGILFLNSIAQ